MNTTNILSKSIAVIATLLVCEATMHAANAVLVNGTTGNGELLMGIRATGTFDTFGATTNVVIDLGSAATFAALSAGTVLPLYSLGSDLDSRFSITSGVNAGTKWYDRPDLLWSTISGNGRNDISTNTLYAGVASSSPGTFPLTTVGYNRQANTAQGSVVTNFQSAAAGTGGFTTSPEGSLSNIAIEDTTSNVNSWSARAAALFGSSALTAVKFEQPFGPGSLGAGVEGALDVYRLVRTTVNDPDTGVTTGTGSYQFTLQINQAGNVTATVLPVPEPASIGLLMAGGMFLVGSRRRKAGARAVVTSVA